MIGDPTRSTSSRMYTFHGVIEGLEPELAAPNSSISSFSSLTSEFSGCVLRMPNRQAHHQEPGCEAAVQLAGTRRTAAMPASSTKRSRNSGHRYRPRLPARGPTELHLLQAEIHLPTRYICRKRIGYARYIPTSGICRPTRQKTLPPDFSAWFETGCNDEFRHGEAFAIAAARRSRLLTGMNKLLGAVLPVSVYADDVMSATHRASVVPQGAGGRFRPSIDYKVFAITEPDQPSGLSDRTRHRQARVSAPRWTSLLRCRAADRGRQGTRRICGVRAARFGDGRCGLLLRPPVSPPDQVQRPAACDQACTRVVSWTGHVGRFIRDGGDLVHSRPGLIAWADNRERSTFSRSMMIGSVAGIMGLVGDPVSPRFLAEVRAVYLRLWLAR